MARTKKKKKNILHYVKETNGIHRMKIDGKSTNVAKGELVSGFDFDFGEEGPEPKGFREVDGDKIPKETVKEEEKSEPEKISSLFKMVSKGNGWYDVVNIETGEKVNTKNLRKEAALALLDVDEEEVEVEEEENND